MKNAITGNAFICAHLFARKQLGWNSIQWGQTQKHPLALVQNYNFPPLSRDSCNLQPRKKGLTQDNDTVKVNYTTPN